MGHVNSKCFLIKSIDNENTSGKLAVNLGKLYPLVTRTLFYPNYA